MQDVSSATLNGPRAKLDADTIRATYSRYAKSYDSWFGVASRGARHAAVAAVNAAPGAKVLEVGVGTGLALPHYTATKRITGIDLSREMLSIARERVAEMGLRHVEALEEMDAQATSFEANSFDVAVAMFVASVVPDPHALVKELRRVVKPGGKILFVNHFARESGPIWWIERAMAGASGLLGWHPDFRLGHMFSANDLAIAKVRNMRPLGLFRLVELPN
ncbi:MAG: methyltransferase domain-containing protein [Rhodospirillales bacterium]|nr:methyltransferase domain-containing protein [Rhodospirillales bacterium]MDE2319508.1 class I SAM-dependent methyltransferase [Rhodospirillales bacterium]